ncbi:MAG: HIT domain-containing protein [Candidatus Omnitrophota bacterium]
MDKLWAPWRIKYVTSKKNKGCIFCAALKSKNHPHVIFRSRHAFCILNIFPYNNGHVMIAPNKHVGDTAGLTDSELLDIFKSINTAKNIIHKALAPDGYNIGINISRHAGAGITGHIHIHIVPRWQGDTNFMPVVHNTKIISQSLKELEKKLKAAYAGSKADK